MSDKKPSGLFNNAISLHIILMLLYVVGLASFGRTADITWALYILYALIFHWVLIFLLLIISCFSKSMKTSHYLLLILLLPLLGVSSCFGVMFITGGS